MVINNETLLVISRTLFYVKKQIVLLPFNQC